MRRLERRDHPFGLRQTPEGGQRLVVGRADVLGAARVAEEGVLGAYARIVEARRDRVGVEHLAVFVGEERGARPVEDARPAGAEAGCAGGLDADEPNLGVIQKACKEADRVRASADAGDRDLGQAAFGGEDLLTRLSSDHGLQLAHDLGIRSRPDARADQVVGRLDVRLARRLLQRLRPELDRSHLRPEQAHPLHVRRLTAHVFDAHVDDAIEAEPRANGRCRDAVLAGAGLRDDSALAEPPRQHGLAEGVVELVRAGMEQVLALQVDALAGGEALGKRERRGPAAVAAPKSVQLVPIRRIGERFAPAALQLVERRNQRLGHVAPAVVAVGESGRAHRAAATKARTRS